MRSGSCTRRSRGMIDRRVVYIIINSGTMLGYSCAPIIKWD